MVVESILFTYVNRAMVKQSSATWRKSSPAELKVAVHQLSQQGPVLTLQSGPVGREGGGVGLYYEVKGMMIRWLGAFNTVL